MRYISILVSLAENGFVEQALEGATACKGAYWDECLWNHVATVRNYKQYLTCSVPRFRSRIMEAAARGRADRLSWLLRRRCCNIAELQARDGAGSSALYYAIFGQHIECVELLVAAGVDCNKPCKISQVVFEPNAEFFLQMFGNGADFAYQMLEVLYRHPHTMATAFCFELLQYSCEYGYIECIIKLISSGVDVQRHDPASNKTNQWFDRIVSDANNSLARSGKKEPKLSIKVSSIFGVHKCYVAYSKA